MTEVSKEAVEALHAALSCTSSIDGFSVGAPAEVIKHLNARGFIIARAEPPMSEAELEREARELSLYAGNNSDPDDMTMSVLDAIELVKKYRRM